MSADHDQLANSLKQAKTKPMFFALVAKGTEGKLLVEKVKVPAKATAEAKKECGGGTIYQGRCLFEGDTMVFETPKEPPATLAALIKNLIKTDAGMAMKVAVRANAALGEQEEGGTETQETPAPEAPVPPSAPPPDPRGPVVMNRLNAMTPGIKAALAGPNKARVQTLFVGANAALKSHDYAQAEKMLDELGPLISPGPAAPAAPPAPPAAGAEVLKRLNALSAGIKIALAGPSKARVQTLFVGVNTAIKSQDFAQAGKVLDELETLVGTSRTAPAAAAAANGGAKKPVSMVALQQARLAWDSARKTVATQLADLQKTILAEFQDDPDLPAAAQAAKKLDGVLKVFDEALSDKLDAALNAAAPELREKLQGQAAKLLKKYRGVVAGNRLLKGLDANPFKAVTVHKTLTDTLTDLEGKLLG